MLPGAVVLACLRAQRPGMWPGSSPWRTLPGRCTGRRLAGALITCCPPRTSTSDMLRRSAVPEQLSPTPQRDMLRRRGCAAVPCPCVPAAAASLSFPRSARGAVSPVSLPTCRVVSVSCPCQNLTGAVESIIRQQAGMGSTILQYQSHRNFEHMHKILNIVKK